MNFRKKDLVMPSVRKNKTAVIDYPFLFFSPASPIIGVDVTGEQLLGPTLICVTSTLECVSLPLVYVTVML